MIVVAILHRHLALRVGTEIGHHLALLTDIGQRAHDEMGQIERHGHIVLRLVGGIAEHHSLIAGTLIFGLLTLDAPVDVGTLLMDGREDTTALCVKLILGLRIADMGDGAAGHRLQIDVSLGAHLAHDHHLTGSDKCLYCRVRILIIGQKLVKDGVTDLVGHLIGMTFRN